MSPPQTLTNAVLLVKGTRRQTKLKKDENSTREVGRAKILAWEKAPKRTDGSK